MRILLGILLFIPTFLAAQPFTVEGTVVDAATKQGVANALVFINQSYQSTRTDGEGKYSLSDVKDKTFEVVVVSKGYETLFYDAVPNVSKTTIKFEVVKADTSAVAYVADGWSKWGRYFLANVLGPSKSAEECELINPDALHFKFNDTTNELTVTAEDVLMIINDGLGYMLNFKLETFKAQLLEGTFTAIGYTSFKNLTTKRAEVIAKWDQRRREAYLGSSMHFIRSLYQNKLDENGYELHVLRRVFEDEPGFVSGKKVKDAIVFNSGSAFKDGKNKKFVYLLDKKKLPADSIRKVQGNNCYLIYPQIIQVIFNGEKEEIRYVLQVLGTTTPAPQKSYLQALNAIWLQPNGLWTENKDLLISGYMRWEKLAEMLPVEYVMN